MRFRSGKCVEYTIFKQMDGEWHEWESFGSDKKKAERWLRDVYYDPWFALVRVETKILKKGGLR